jgi:hypothetical protein
MTELIIIIVSIIYIWNWSGFIFDLSKGIFKVLNPNKAYNGQPIMKPFGCALCMVFWCTILYSIFGLGLTLIISLGVGVASSIVSTLVDRLLGVTIKLINKIQ